MTKSKLFPAQQLMVQAPYEFANLVSAVSFDV